MAGEWVVPAVSGIVALAGVGASVFTTIWTQKQLRERAQDDQRERQADRDEARDQWERDRAHAHQQWLRDRRADAYVQILGIAEEVRTVAGSLEFARLRDANDVMKRMEAARSAVAAYGSAAVNRAVFMWHVPMTQALTTPAGTADAEKWREEMHKYIDRLGEAIRKDLTAHT